MEQIVNVNFKLEAEVKKSIPFETSVDPFYSESNIRYLENIARDMKDGQAHFAEHDLTEVGDFDQT